MSLTNSPNDGSSSSISVLHDLLEAVQVAGRTADAGHAGTLVAEQEFGVGPALVFLADQVFDRHAHVFEKDVVDLVRTVDGDDRAHGDARRLHVDQQERDAGLRLCRSVGADQAENPVGMLGQRRPGLVAVDDVVVAVAHRLGADRCEVGARARLRIALAPPVLAGENPRQELLLLRFVAERVDDRADHGDAERQRRQRPGTRRLLFEEEALRDRPARSAMFLRPQRRDPSLLVEDAMPQQHLLLGQVGLRIGNAHFLRIVLRDEGAHLVAKRRILAGKAQFHRDAPATTSRRTGVFPARTSRRSSAAGRAASRIPRPTTAASGDRDRRGRPAPAPRAAAGAPIRCRRRNR